MLHQRYKDLVYWGISKAALPNHLLRRYVSSATAGAPLHLHLGCGHRYMPSFVNIDGNPFRKIDAWLDVRNGLPFASNSVDSIYSTHMFEHFYPDELERVLRECVRVLKPEGGIRLVVPNLGSAILAYSQQRLDWFSPFPRQFDSLGGKFSNFIFVDGQHRTAFDFTYMDEILKRTGFGQVEESGEGKSRLYGDKVPSYEPKDAVGLSHSLYVEGFKSAVSTVREP